MYRRTFCIGGHFVEGRFVEGGFVKGHFVGRTFCSEGRFVEGCFVLVPKLHTYSSLFPELLSVGIVQNQQLILLAQR